MATSIDWPTKVISVYRDDLIHVSGTIYRCDTNALRKELKQLEASEGGRVYPVTHTHNDETSAAGVVYARVINLQSPYSIQFLPDEQWTVILQGSNNNLFDVENGILAQNQVQVIPTNSAGLQTVAIGTAVTPQDKTDIINGIFNYQYEGAETFAQYLRLSRSILWGIVAKVGNVFSFRSRDNGKTRITATTDGSGSRTNVSIDDAD